MMDLQGQSYDNNHLHHLPYQQNIACTLPSELFFKYIDTPIATNDDNSSKNDNNNDDNNENDNDDDNNDDNNDDNDNDDDTTRADNRNTAVVQTPVDALDANADADGDGDNKNNNNIDPEAMLQNMLSALATQPDLTTSWKKGPKQDIPKWLWKVLTVSNDEIGSPPKSDSVDYQWWMGARFIHHFITDHNTETAETNNSNTDDSVISPNSQQKQKILPTVTPFELHSVVNDSIIFADGSTAHSTLCLLLCAYALLQCPTPTPTPTTSSQQQQQPLQSQQQQSLQSQPVAIIKRWKRWQSLVCETIRLFQNYGVDEIGELTLPVWIHHVVPACLHVITKLPTQEQLESEQQDATASASVVYRVAFLSSLIGTCSKLASRECHLPETTRNIATSTILQDHIQVLLETVRTVLNAFGYSESWVWLSPWRRLSSSKRSEIEDRCERIELMQHKDHIEWWSRVAHRHESVAGMDTSWDTLGISLLAILSYENRPMVLSPNFVWKVWFPHVSILLKSVGTAAKGDADLQFLEPLPFYLMDNLVQIIPENSLPSVGSNSTKVDAPFETFQLLSNRILVQTEKEEADGNIIGGNDSNGKLSVMDQRDTFSKARSERMVALMKGLLTRYHPINQVKIVRKLVHDCPHPGLRAKFMDLLRPVLFKEEAYEALWTYIRTFVRDLLEHHDEAKRILINTSDLVEKVEIFVAAITMIQLWVMVKGKVPKKISAKPLGRLYKTLQKTLGDWLDDTNLYTAPDDYYRLFLLEGALKQVIINLDSVRNGTKSASTVTSVDTSIAEDGDEASVHSTPASSNETSPMITTAQKKPKYAPPPAPPAPIVGEVDIFL